MFDLGLADEARVMLVRYERFAAAPDSGLASIYRFAGARYPGSRIARDIHARTVGKGDGVQLAAEIEAYCEDLWARLIAADEAGHERRAADTPAPG